MDLRSALATWAGGGAAQNARRSLDEWDRAQEEVSALLERLGQPDTPSPATTTLGPGATAHPHPAA